MAILNFIINEIFGQGSIFLALVAMVGLILQKKSVSEVVRGTLMTAIGFFVLNTGTGLITGNSIDGIINAFNTLMPGAGGGANVDIGGQYGTQIGIVMILAFAINLLVARFTPWKSVFLTGHMLYWFPYVFIAAGVDAGLTGGKLIGLAAVFTALYMIVAPNLMRPLVKDVTGKDDFTIGHPTTTLSVLAGIIAPLVGDKSKSCEDLKLPKSLGFLREVSITGSIAISLVYIIMYFVVSANGLSPAEVLAATNDAVCSNNPQEMFVTVWLGILEISTGILRAANAGHEFPALKCGERFELLRDKHGLVIGALEGVRYTEYTVQLQRGDKIFLYTDGVPEATNSNNELFGTRRMIEALNQAPDAAPKEILSNVKRSVDRFVGKAEQFDDLTMLCFSYR